MIAQAWERVNEFKARTNAAGDGDEKAEEEKEREAKYKRARMVLHALKEDGAVINSAWAYETSWIELCSVFRVS